MTPTEEQYKEALGIAAKRGKDAGRSAAEWWEQDAIGGRVVHQRDAIATAQRVLAAIENGDPRADLPQADLSGEWADSLTGPALVAECWEEVGIEADEDAFDEICTAYEAAFDQAAQDAIERACRDLLEEEATP